MGCELSWKVCEEKLYHKKWVKSKENKLVHQIDKRNISIV